jgi:hypothetical protein
MAKAAEANAAVDSIAQDLSAKQGLTITPDLIALIAAAVSAAVKEANRDEDKEAEKARKAIERQQVIDEENQRIANLKAKQDACPHLDAYENYAFVGQRNCKGELVFLCSQCVKPFQPGDSEYGHYIRFVKADRVGNARLNV